MKSCEYIFILLLVAACEKDAVAPLENRPPQPMLKTITNFHNSGDTFIQHFYYDTLWRLQIRETYNSTYHSTNADTLVYDSLNGGIYVNGWKYLSLNSSGLVDNEGYGSSDFHYSYNANTNMIEKWNNYGHGNYVYDANYNMTEYHYDVENGTSGRIYYNHFYIYNSLQNTIGNYNKGEYYYGKSSENLVEREEWSWNFSSAIYPNEGYTLYNYSFNDSGWVSRMEQQQVTILKDTSNIPYDSTFTFYRVDYTYY